jgi:hypothetical protein
MSDPLNSLPVPPQSPSTPPASMSPTPEPVPLPTPAFQGLWLRDLEAAAHSQTPWLWDGYLAPGNVTLLTSQWKSGKTTLVAVLLSRLKTGGLLLGRSLRPGKAAIVSEESPLHWHHRSQKLAFGGHLCWFCRPFRGKPRPDEWLALLDHLLALRQQHGIDLVVIDPLASFLPGRNENSAAEMLATLMPLQRLTTQGVSVLVLHHPRKGDPAAGQAARGSGALCGYADILLEMQHFGRPSDDDRRRHLRAYSRHEETPRHVVIELSADGTDYLCHGDGAEEEFSHSWRLLRSLLEDALHKLTQRELLEQWPTHLPKPTEVTVWRWLERALSQGQVLREGTGRKNDPYRYWLPGQEDKWRQSPFYLPEMPQIKLAQQMAEEVRRRLLGE